jgi:hypothetical protein
MKWLASRIFLPIALIGAAVALVMIPGVPPTQAQPAQPAAKLSSDLALIPGEALGFVHVRVAEIWKSDAMTETRKFFQKAGPKALALLDTDFTPAPSTLERMTLVALPFKEQPEPRLVSIFAFSAPFDSAKVRKQYMPNAKEVKAGTKSYFEEKSIGAAIYFPNDTTIVLGDGETLPQFLSLGNKSDSPLKSAIETASTKAMTGCLNLKALPIPPDLMNDVPEDFRPLFKAERLLLSAEMNKEVTLSIQLGFPTAEAAKEGEKGVRKAADFGRQALAEPKAQAEKLVAGKKNADGNRNLEQLAEAIGGVAMLAAVNSLDEFLADPPLKVTGTNLGATVSLPVWATQYIGVSLLSAGLALPAVQKVREAAARTQSTNNLKQIALAMHSYHDVNGTFPPAAICDKKGKKLLSWRVAILPFIEQDNLYKQFKLDEPWDSEHNKKFSSVMIKTYTDPRSTDSSGKTHYKLFVGKDTPFNWVASMKLAGITDGTSNTIMVVAAGDPVEWAKPDDFEFDPEKKLPDLSKPFPILLAAMCDGSVRAIRTDMKDFDKLMKLLIQANDGQVIPNFE